MFILDTGTICNAIPPQISSIIANVIRLIQIAVPIILVIMGMLDLGKAVVAQKEDEIKKGQQTFLKRLIAAALVFLVVFIAQFVVQFIGDETSEFWSCAKSVMGV